MILYDHTSESINVTDYRPIDGKPVSFCTRCQGRGWELVTSKETVYKCMCLGCYGRGVVGLTYNQTITEKIQQRRYQMLVHSFLYYELGESVVSDYHFDMWAQELVVLQESYPHQSSQAPYHDEFKDFDGSSGFDLPYDRPEIQERAYRLLESHRERLRGI